MLMSIIKKDEKIKIAKEILNDKHSIKTGYGWEIIFANLLSECKDCIEVHGYGHQAYFSKK